MDTPLDLYGASREELMALLLAQRERLADQEHEIVHQRGELATRSTATAHPAFGFRLD
jgi:hypothetical protein